MEIENIMYLWIKVSIGNRCVRYNVAQLGENRSKIYLHSGPLKLQRLFRTEKDLEMGTGYLIQQHSLYLLLPY